MDDAVYVVAVRQSSYGLPVADVALNEGNAALPLRYELLHQFVSRGYIVTDHFMPGPGQFPDNVRSDESGSSSDQSSHICAPNYVCWPVGHAQL